MPLLGRQGLDLPFDVINLAAVDQRPRRHRAGVGGVEIKELASGMYLTSRLGDALRIKVPHQTLL